VQAVVLREVKAELEVTELADPPLPSAGGGQQVLDVLGCGICHSDLHVVDGDYPVPLPRVLGHEVTARHHQLGPVIVYPCWGCRRPGCRQCAQGQENICPDSAEVGLFCDGGYSDRILVTRPEYLVPLGDLDPVRAAPLACGGLTAYRAVDQTLATLRMPLPGSARPRVLVIGAGGLGQFAIQFLRLLTDAEVVAADPAADKRDRALAVGAEAVADPDAVDGRFDAVLDFVAARATLELAARSVARQGLLVTIGLFGGQIPFGLGTVPHEARLTTSIWGSLAQLHDLIALAARFELSHAVEVMPLAAAQQAHDRLRAGQVQGRIVLVPQVPS
jgi:alcohol dehydrogenase, propanol-preferring